MLLDERDIQEKFLAFFACNKIEVVLMHDEIMPDLKYWPVSYTQDMLAYQKAYISAFSTQILDLSVTFLFNRKPVGGWPLSIRVNENKISFTSYESFVLKPVFSDEMSRRLRKRVYEVCLNGLSYIRKEVLFQLDTDKFNFSLTWQGQHSIMPGYDDEWYRKCMEKGSSASVINDMYTNLLLPESTIHQSIRKSFRSLINEGERKWKIEIYTKNIHNAFEKFRLMHSQVAGRVTRPQETWDLQEKAIEDGNAFLILLKEDTTLLGGGLFNLSKTEGYYSVGVYDRSRFTEPIGHVIQWHAIKYMKSLGIQWYKIGRRAYPGDKDHPSDKRVQISYFQEGFATNLFLRVITDCPFEI